MHKHGWLIRHEASGLGKQCESWTEPSANPCYTLGFFAYNDVRVYKTMRCACCECVALPSYLQILAV